MSNVLYDESRVNNVINEMESSNLVGDNLLNYARVMKEKVVKGIDNIEFQKDFFTFYGLNRGPHASDLYKKKYFETMKECLENWSFDFPAILRSLYEVSEQADITYAAKMIHTLNPKYPAWGQDVEAAISELWQGELDDAERVYHVDHFRSACMKWDVLQRIYKEMQSTGEYDEYVKAFDRKFPKYIDIPDMKKVDYALWNYGKQILEDR